MTGSGYEDLHRVPEHLVAEIIDGALIVHPRPAPNHTQGSSLNTMVMVFLGLGRVLWSIQ